MKKPKSIILLFALLLILLLTPARVSIRQTFWSVLTSPVRLVGSIGHRTGGLFGALVDVGKLRSKNRELTDKIVSFEVDSSRIEELVHENELLKKELGFFEEDKQEQLIPARIIGRDPTAFLDYIIVDQGRGDGVAEKAPVISGGVLIGQVAELYDHQSKILLISSKNSLIQAMLQSSRAKGILRGGASGVVLEDISQDVEVGKDEFVLTSGLGGGIKEGILIGKVKSVQLPTSGILKNIAIEPIVDLSTLELVFVIKK